MKKHIQILTLVFLFTAISSHALPTDTLHVVTHKQLTIVTDPSKGYNLYKAWGVFPKANVPIRKILLHVTFSCPDNMRCADWDYKDHITIRRKGGVQGASQDYEIGRMLTPYGGAFDKNWKFNWTVDVTDFSMLLRDSVEIEYNHTGYEPNNDRGWSVTLDFEIITGQPSWEPISIQKIYDNSYRYGDSSNNIENALRPVAFTADAKADFARLRMVQTGHGMDEPDGCGEFCNKYRELWYDGKLLEKKAIWMQCGNNPLYPQAGTWVYDRANWCPGILMQPDLYELPVKAGQQHTIDVNMQHYVAKNPSADEVISAYLIQYKKAASKHDVALVDIINPSLKDAYKRQNPSVMHPSIIVQNRGGEMLKQLSVRYGTKSFAKQTFKWKGTLQPGAVTTISLPGIIEGGNGIHGFEVELLKPNGRPDGYPQDNKMVSAFEAASTLTDTLIVYMHTNEQPAQNSYAIKKSEGKIIRERSFGSLQADSVYRDTIPLPAGHYQFLLLDSAGNGLEFWANRRGGRGKARLLNTKGQMILDIESDFGSSIQYDFKVGGSATPVTTKPSIGLYPTRTNDKTTLDYFSNFPEDVVVQIITDPGDKLVEEHCYNGLKEGVFIYDLSRFPKGRFYLRVLIKGEEQFKKRIRLKE